MQVKYVIETAEFVDSLDFSDRARVSRVVGFFEELGFAVGPKYVKKISPAGIWELRAGRIRLLLCIKESTAICVHAVYKKTQKLRKEDIKLAESRCKEI